MTVWRQPDVDLLTLLGSPAFIEPLAMRSGAGDPVLGAPAAFRHSRRMAYRYIRSKLATKVQLAAPQETRTVLRALNFFWRLQAVTVMPETLWAGTSVACWPETAPIQSPCTVKVGDVLENRILTATVRCLSRLLRDDPRLNRAFLRGRVWQRTSPEVMVHVPIAPRELRPLVLDASECSHGEVLRELARQRSEEQTVLQHPFAMAGAVLLRQWLAAGFLASPAGAMVSGAMGFMDRETGRWIPGLEVPTPLLIPGNGVPIAVGIGAPSDGKACFSVVVDHRVFDADGGARIHAALKEEVPQLCRD